MRRYIIILLACFALAPLAARHNIDSLLVCLDRAIDSSRYYVDKRLARIDGLNRRLARSRSWQERYSLNLALYGEYRAYKNDSALAFLDRCITLARRNGDRRKANRCMTLTAFQCTETGMYAEGRDVLSAIDTTSLDEAGRRDYLVARHHLYGELLFYGKVDWLKDDYVRENDALVKQLFARLPHDSSDYMLLSLMTALFRDDVHKALAVSDEWIKLVKPGSHPYAIASFYRYLVYRKIGNMDEALYWVIQSSLSDVHNAVMDQGSLWELANILKDRPDNLERSYRYINFAWTAAQTFNTKVRSNQISPVLSLIEGKYRESLNRTNTKLYVVLSVVGLLLVVVLALFIYANRQRRRLARTKDELRKANSDLTGLNLQLNDYNTKLSQLNKNLELTNNSLNESNKMKEVYIGRFLGLCSAYIEKTEALKRNISKHLKTKDYARLARLVEHSSDDRDEFYHNFDSAFLKLFPNFVTDFNALLRPESRIQLAADGSLTTTVRIFALIRLGIEDSSRIAEFLNYSVNTIYNYRAKTKNGAACNREEFENEVKKIGMR